MERADKAPDRSTRLQPAARTVPGLAAAPAFVDQSSQGAELTALVQMMQGSAQVAELGSLVGKMQTGPQATAQLALNARQADGAAGVAQRVEGDEEELLQGKFAPVQRVEGDEEELLQGKFALAQRAEMEDEEPLQGKFGPAQRAAAESSPAPSPNRTGLPDGLKAGIESLSGISLDQVRVHYNSSQPAQLNAHAYAQGNEIHLAPGQEQHLPHEAWHVVQQAQGRVKPTTQLKGGVAVNDDTELEREADVMGAKALSTCNLADQSNDIQRRVEAAGAHTKVVRTDGQGGTSSFSFPSTRFEAEQRGLINFARASQLCRSLSIAGGTTNPQHRSASIARSGDRVLHNGAGPNNAIGHLPIQMVKIMVDGIEYETNGKSYDELRAIANRVAPEDQEKLKFAIFIAYNTVERESPPLISSQTDNRSTLRRRRTAPVAQTPNDDHQMPSARAQFATVDGVAAHGPGAWVSTGGSFLTGAPDLAALNNSAADATSMASRTLRDVGKGNLKDASISATQSVLSGAQAVLSTPVAHALNHAAGAAFGLPFPLPAADALWYPANFAKERLEDLRDPKLKTE